MLKVGRLAGYEFKKLIGNQVMKDPDVVCKGLQNITFLYNKINYNTEIIRFASQKGKSCNGVKKGDGVILE